MTDTITTFRPEWASELTVLWTKAQPIVAAFISSSVRDFHAAEDVLQEVAEAVATNFDRYDRDSSFIAWSVGIARHKVFDHFRRIKKDPHIFDAQLLSEIAQAYESIEDEFDGMSQALAECVRQLRGRARKVLDLRYKRELAPSLVAGKMGITLNATYILLSRVRDVLGRCIEHRMTLRGEA